MQIGGTQGLAPEKAVRAALPALRLPRNSGDPRLKLADSVENAIKFFRGALDEAQPALYLKARDGDPLNRTELKRRLEQMEAENALPPEVVSKLLSLGITAKYVPGSEQQASNARDIPMWKAIAAQAQIKLD